MSTTHTDYTVPDNPADPKAAALNLIVQLPGQGVDEQAVLLK